MHRRHLSETCRVERQNRTVSDHNTVRRILFDHSIDRGREPVERLLGSLGPKHEPVRLSEESRNRCLKLDSRRKEARVAPMMFLEPIGDPGGNSEGMSNNLGGLDSFWFFTTPDHTGIETKQSGG